MRVEKKGKGKRKAVPTALRSELEEYSFLLRALRTNDTLDLSSQLIRAAVDSPQTPEDDDAHDSPSTPPVEASVPNQVSRKPKDVWTRWPLPIQDVPIPEWTLQDEVERLANRFLQPPNEAHGGTEDDAEELIDPVAIKHLTLETTEYLSLLFATIAAHVPMVEGSMQNRLKPLNWENILAIVGATGVIDPWCGLCTFIPDHCNSLPIQFHGASFGMSGGHLRHQRAGRWARLDSIVESSLIFHRVDLSVHRTRLIKESHDQLLQLCSSIGQDLMSIQVPPTKPAKRKGHFFTLFHWRFLTALNRYKGKVQSHREV